MKIEDVNAIIENDKIVILKQMQLVLHYKVIGVISRYNKKTGWHYFLELQDLNTQNSITVAKLEDVMTEEDL